MEKNHKVDQSAASSEIVVETYASYVSRRTRSTQDIRHSSTQTDWAEAVFVVEDQEQEEPTENATINFNITDLPVAAPSERAEVSINLAESQGSVNVPGRFAGQLLNGCIAAVCTLSVGYTNKWILEASKDSRQDWIVLVMVVAQIIGIAVLAWRAMRRQP